MQMPFTSHHYQSLSGLVNQTPGERLRIAIVTPDLLGPVKNGGIGTACSHLAYELAAAEHRVTILFAQPQTKAASSEPWIENYTKYNIQASVLECLSDPLRAEAFPNHHSLITSYQIYQWLAQHDSVDDHFDIIIFMEWQGGGFYALHAKKNGSCFKNTALVVQIHSPSLWHSVHNAELSGDAEQSITWQIERQCIEMADAVTSPSAYMLDWCCEQGYEIPNEACVLQNFLRLKSVASDVLSSNNLAELVFFGRLEYRKGLIQFCDAVDILLAETSPSFKVTFLGKPAWVGQEHAGQFIGRRSKEWPVEVSMLTDYDHYQAVAYLSEGGRLAVMPSVADNSPYTVYECLKAKIPFIARATGGITELVPCGAHSECLCSDTPQSLALKMQKALHSGICCPGLAFGDDDIHAAWMKYLYHIAQKAKKTRQISFGEKSHSKISVCLTHYRRPHLLQQAVESLLAQDYQNFEVILADDGSPDEESKAYLMQLQALFDERGWKILRLENGYTGKARNEAVRIAKGEWLLFFDDDNVAETFMLRRFLESAQRSGNRLVTCVFKIFTGDEKPSAYTPVLNLFLPIGSAIAWSTVSNAIGDTTSLIHRSLFRELGGFSEDYGLGHEDFELLLKAVLSGEKVGIHPEPLFWYRSSANSVQRSTNMAANRIRSMRPFLQMLPPVLAEMALLTHALATKDVVTHDRMLYAPPQLDAKEQKAFALRSPISPETLCDVADDLTRNGQFALASQLLNSTADYSENKGAEIEIATCSAEACYAASQKNYPKILFYTMQISKYSDKDVSCAHFYIMVLEALHKQPLSEHYDLSIFLCRKLIKLQSLTCRESVLAAIICIELKCISEALDMAGFALLKAESAYFDMRQDVKKAVADGKFTSALHHFVLHGESDKIFWPEEDMFRTLGKYFLECTEPDEILHENLTQYFWEAFSDEK